MKKKISKTMKTGLGEFSKKRFAALIDVRACALAAFREFLEKQDYTEVSFASLVNVAGSCENPNLSFTLPFYGREAHLSQSAQLQLEALVIRLQRKFFTVNNSFREEHFDDPASPGRRLSEFTLIEAEAPALDCPPENALYRTIEIEEAAIKFAVKRILDDCTPELIELNAPRNYLESILNIQFHRIDYYEALAWLRQWTGKEYAFGDDLEIAEERLLLSHFRRPVFVTHFPAVRKFFNMKRVVADSQVTYTVDLLLPNLGETIGGGVREEGGKIIRRQFDELMASRLRTLNKGAADPGAPFQEYFNLFKQEPPLLRAGFGIGFERFIGFLLGSNDILQTIAHRMLRP